MASIAVEEKEINNLDEIQKVLDDIDTYKYCKTDILHHVKFVSKMDQFIFDSLPLSMSQKEELLLSLYGTGTGYTVGADTTINS